MSQTTFLRHTTARLLVLIARVQATAGAFVDVWIRVSLARAFFVSGVVTMMHPAEGMQFAHQTYPAMLMDGSVSAALAVMAQLVAPVFLLVGFLARPAALAMLALSVVVQIGYQGNDVNLCWIALLTWYVFQGVGPFSIDRLLKHGLMTSALPFAAPALRAAAALSQTSRPWLLLAGRVWIALTLARIGWVVGNGLPMANVTMLPVMSTIPAALLLLLGLFVPVVSLALATVASGVDLMMPTGGITLYFPLVLVLLALQGAGPLSFDWLLTSRLSRGRVTPGELPHVVVVGAGFGGMACVAKLRFAAVRVTVVDKRNFHLFQPLLYQVATASLSPADIATPIRGALRDQSQVRVLHQTVTAVDRIKKRITTDHGELAYDYLVLATGASHGYFDHPEWAQHAPGLKSVEDAIAIRRRVLAAFEMAESASSPERQRVFTTFVICGGGPTGVELAGALAELSRTGLKREFRSFDPASAQIILVQSGPRLLPAFDARLSESARAGLERLGVDVRLNSRVQSIDAKGVMINGAFLEAAVVLWAAGVVASPAAQWLGQTGDGAGRVNVDADLSVPDCADVFAIGDTAASLAWDGKLLPGLAPAAKQSGAYVARVIRARLEGKPPPAPFRYRHQGSLATIGRKTAVADFGALKLRGAIAWWLWGTIHLFFLLGTRNRISVGIGWMWSYFTYDVAVQLITEETPGS